MDEYCAWEVEQRQFRLVVGPPVVIPSSQRIDTEAKGRAAILSTVQTAGHKILDFFV
jgi:hypothetical protein